MNEPLGELRFKNLNQRASCIEQIALWHHHEWLRGTGKAIDPSTFGSQLDQRVELLKQHVNGETIPSTFIVEKVDSDISEFDGDIVGTVSLVNYDLNDQRSASKWITNLFVVPDYRGKGIGSELLQFAEEFAAGSNVDALNLYTHDQQEFYKKRAWQVLGDARLHNSMVTVFRKNF